MHTPSSRSVLAARAIVAHLTGLIVVGLYQSFGTTAGFGSGASISILMGGIVSIPWFAALCLFLWFFAETIERHIISFCIGGPILVCGSWWAVAGSPLLEAVTISSVTAGVAFLALTLWQRYKDERRN